MDKRIEEALNNVTIVVQQARMTASEHATLAENIKLIRESLGKSKKE